MGNGIIRKRLVFSGTVQGVGFRWRARRAAEALGATGWVRNDWGDTVTMEIQGTETQIDAVLSAIGRSAYIRIESIEAQTVPVVKNERDFVCAD